MARSKETKIELTAYDDLFETDQSREEAKLSKIRDIPISEIDEFPDHPFKVFIDEDMEQLVDSIKRNGVMTPATVRLKEDGRYELISGHRRKKACELAGLETLKCEVKDLSRDEAIIVMVESNLQRSTILPSEKAFAYKMRLEAMNRQGQRTLTRRNWHSSSAYTKTIWQCVTATKQGKKYCPHCKGIPEEVIEKAFVKSYQLLCSDQQQVVEEFLQKVEGVLNEDTSLKRLPKIEKEMNDLRKRKEKLLDLRLDTTIDRDIYESKNRELSEQLKKLQEEQEQLLELSKNRENTRTRLREFRKNLSSGEILEDFDRVVFESVVEKIIIGGYNKEGVEEPLKITFVYKTGIHSNFNGKDFKPKRRNAAALHSDAELCSYASDEAAELCSHSSNDTHRAAGSPRRNCGRAYS